MQIRPTNGFSGVNSVSLPTSRPVNTEAVQSTHTDQVELSFEAQMLARANEGIRADRVAYVKSQIASGVYETPEKIAATIERLLDEYA
ncbi:MAG: flagellar biosynthesis anti-sigma factor FlgM [Planctomycetota bacterium]|jgi:anti-sigma28 factor (negative regulator of flagellin synthesis)|nr:flagellar biosynthesis anti-sigma factor FlgM [Blastopirellula sp.]